MALPSQTMKILQMNSVNILQILDSLLASTHESPCKYVKRNPSSNSFFLFSISPNSCAVLIAKLKNTKTDINTMPVKIFSSLHDILSVPVSKLMNASFSLGVFPHSLKKARLTPVHKRGNKQDPSNYRPISSLPYLSKIFERYVTNQLISFFAKYNLLSKNQFGFQRNISTTDALIKLTESIYKSLNNKQHHISILIDLKKAFDTMNHQIILKKLDLYGIRGLPRLWIESYLSDRLMFVGVSKATSDTHVSNIGIPQGSIIGPLLFLIFINDLPNVSDKFDTCLFADDTTLSISNSNSTVLIDSTNLELEKINKWTLANRLTINVEKTELIVFSNRYFDKTSNHISLDNKLLTYSTCCKFLGVCIDSDLTFSQHIRHVVGKLSRGAGILYNIRDSLTTPARISYYYGFLYPYISCNVVIWASTGTSHLQPLIKQQKRIVRTMTNAKVDDHTSPLFRRLGLLTVIDVFKFQLLVQMYKANKGDYKVSHQLNTRNRNILQPSFHRLTKTQHAFSHIGPSEWNKLPLILKESENIKLFKKKLKKFFIDQYALDPG